MSVDRIRILIDSVGKTVTVQRMTGVPPAVSVSVQCKAAIHDYSPEQLVGPIQQGDRELRIAPREFDNMGIVPRQGDRIIIDGAMMIVENAYSEYIYEDVGFYVLRCRG